MVQVGTKFSWLGPMDAPPPVSNIPATHLHNAEMVNKHRNFETNKHSAS